MTNPSLSSSVALDFRKKHLPSYTDRATGKTTLYKFRSRTGRFCSDNAVTRCCDPCCEGNVSTFAPFGSGITSYFKFQKTLMSAFFIMACLSVPAITINTFGNPSSTDGESTQYTIAKTTVGNIVGVNGTDLIDLPYTDNMYTVSQAAVVYASLDLICAVILCLAYAAVRLGLDTERKQVEGNSLKAQDYTIFIPWLPHDTTESDLRTWIVARTVTKRKPEGYEVADVNIVDDNMGLLRIFRLRGAIFRALIRVDQAISELEHKLDGRPAKFCCDSEYGQLRVLKTTHDALRKRADKLTLQANAFKSRGTTGAFVTFESQLGPRVLLKRYPASTMNWLCQPQKARFKGRRIALTRASEPSTVLWHNLNITSCSQRCRQSFTGLIAFILILISFAFIIFASMKNTEFQTALKPVNCNAPYLVEGFANGTYSNVTLLSAAPGSPELACYCKMVPWGDFESFTDVYSYAYAEKCPEQSCIAMFEKSASETAGVQFCVAWLYSYATALGMTVGASLSIVIVNILLSNSMRLMTALEGHHSTEDLEKSLVLRLFFAQFLNTAILTIIINAAWDTITGMSLPIPATGLYDDFTPGWYNTVGASFHSTMITQAIVPHIGPLIGMYFARKKVKRAEAENAATLAQQEADTDATNELKAKIAKKLRRRAPHPHFKLQEDYNESMIGVPADYVLRYVQMLTTVYVCYVFSSGMPLLIPIAAVSVAISYNVDKLAFLRLYRRPPASSNRMAVYINELLPLCILLHLAVGVWVLGSLSSFREAFVAATGLGDTLAYVQSTAMAGLRSGLLKTGFTRVTQVQSIPLLVLFALVLAGIVIRIVLQILGSLVFVALDILTCGKFGKMKCCKRCQPHLEDLDESIPTYSEATSPGTVGTHLGIMGVPSYNVLMSPELQALFGIDASYASTHKGLHSIVNFSADDAISASRARTFMRNELMRIQAVSAMEKRETKARIKRQLSEMAKGNTASISISAADLSSVSFAQVNPLSAAKTPTKSRKLQRSSSMRIRQSDYVKSSSEAEAADRILSMLRRRLQSARANIAARRAMEANEGHQEIFSTLKDVTVNFQGAAKKPSGSR